MKIRMFRFHTHPFYPSADVWRSIVVITPSVSPSISLRGSLSGPLLRKVPHEVLYISLEHSTSIEPVPSRVNIYHLLSPWTSYDHKVGSIWRKLPNTECSLSRHFPGKYMLDLLHIPREHCHYIEPVPGVVDIILPAWYLVEGILPTSFSEEVTLEPHIFWQLLTLNLPLAVLIFLCFHDLLP